MNNHTALVNSIRIKLSELGCIALPYITADLRPLVGQGRIKVGLKGVSDIIACTNKGRFVAVEVKTGTGRLSLEQAAFRDAVISRGGIFIEARQVQDLEVLAND